MAGWSSAGKLFHLRTDFTRIGTGLQVFGRRLGQFGLCRCHSLSETSARGHPEPSDWAAAKASNLCNPTSNSSGLGVLVARIARASYGVSVKVSYQPTLHANEDREGEIGLTPTGYVLFDKLSWHSVFVVSYNEASNLSRSLTTSEADRLCSVRTNLTGLQQDQLITKYERGTCFSRGKKYYICSFDVRVIVCPADLRFKLWFGERKWPGNQEPISV
ncbi:unnamed protein product [Clonostachys rosea]|uniref:Uncharacterized protein n=1 Tax=Bionectria ochroleuca TaxID=29856 RepID=A0ABY6UT80_BIOOC|nr:unnamed protein product [Clonostachys rosea]